jgi:amidase
LKDFPYETYDATDLAQLIRSKEVTKKEVLFEAIARIEGFNPTLNAVVDKFYEKAVDASEKTSVKDRLPGCRCF